MGKSVPKESVLGYSVGLNKGYIVTKHAAKPKAASRRRSSKRTDLIRTIIKTVTGLAPYEKKVLELFRVEETKTDKRANRLLRRRLGSWKRANSKRDYIRTVMRRKPTKQVAEKKVNA